MFQLIGQMLACDGPGCFFQIQENAIGEFHVHLWSCFGPDGKKLTLQQFKERRAKTNLPELLDEVICDKLAKAIRWLAEKQDY